MDSKEMLKALNEAFELVKEQEKRKIELGTRKQPYQVFVTRKIYEQIKQYLDEEDMYFCEDPICFGWAKINIVQSNGVSMNCYENKKLQNTKGTNWFGKAWEEQHPRLGHIAQQKTIQEQNKENFKKFIERNK